MDSYFAYVIRPSNAPPGRAPKCRPFWDGFLAYNLRCGFGMGIAALLGISFCALIGGNLGINLTAILSGNAYRLKYVPVPLCAVLSFGAVIGALKILCFRQVCDDDGSVKHNRGYRAGTKCLYHGAILDCISWVMTMVLYFATYMFLEEDWAEQQAGSGSLGIFILAARCAHSLALVLYGMGIFFLELYHNVGTTEMWAWLIISLFKLSALLQIATMACRGGILKFSLDVLFTLCLLAAFTCAFLWSLAFEPVANENEVAMDGSVMRDEYFKSHNCVAYYGPPTLMCNGVQMPNMPIMQGH